MFSTSFDSHLRYSNNGPLDPMISEH